jgi:hypothetical protein
VSTLLLGAAVVAAALVLSQVCEMVVNARRNLSVSAMLEEM